VEVWVYAFLTPELGGGENNFTRQWLYSRVRAPGSVESKVGARVDLKAVEKRKTSALREIKGLQAEFDGKCCGVIL